MNKRPMAPMLKKPVKKATVVWDFEAETGNELDLKAGEMVEVNEKESSGEWSNVKKKDGRIGFVPSSYLKMENSNGRGMISASDFSVSILEKIVSLSQTDFDPDDFGKQLNLYLLQTFPKSIFDCRRKIWVSQLECFNKTQDLCEDLFDLCVERKSSIQQDLCQTCLDLISTSQTLRVVARENQTLPRLSQIEKDVIEKLTKIAQECLTLATLVSKHALYNTETDIRQAQEKVTKLVSSLNLNPFSQSDAFELKQAQKLLLDGCQKLQGTNPSFFSQSIQGATKMKECPVLQTVCQCIRLVIVVGGMVVYVKESGSFQRPLPQPTPKLPPKPSSSPSSSPPSSTPQLPPKPSPFSSAPPLSPKLPPKPSSSPSSSSPPPPQQLPPKPSSSAHSPPLSPKLPPKPSPKLPPKPSSSSSSSSSPSPSPSSSSSPSPPPLSPKPSPKLPPKPPPSFSSFPPPSSSSPSPSPTAPPPKPSPSASFSRPLPPKKISSRPPPPSASPPPPPSSLSSSPPPSPSIPTPIPPSLPPSAPPPFSSKLQHSSPSIHTTRSTLLLPSSLSPPTPTPSLSPLTPSPPPPSPLPSPSPPSPCPPPLSARSSSPRSSTVSAPLSHSVSQPISLSSRSPSRSSSPRPLPPLSPPRPGRAPLIPSLSPAPLPPPSFPSSSAPPLPSSSAPSQPPPLPSSSAPSQPPPSSSSSSRPISSHPSTPPSYNSFSSASRPASSFASPRRFTTFVAGETGGGGERGGERNKGVERNNLVLGTRKSFMEGEGIGGRGGEGLSLSAPVEEPKKVKTYTEEERLHNIILIQRWAKEWFKYRRFYKVVQIYRRHEEAMSGRLRAKTLKEVLTTETTYVNNLILAEAEIFRTLRAVAEKNPSIINQKEIDILCQNWVLLTQVHKSFLVKIQEWYSEWPVSSLTIGDLFSKLAPKLVNLYKKYVTGFDDSSELLVLLEKKPDFMVEKEKIISTLLQQHNCQLDISSFLIMPVQRLPRYEMLLREIIKHTEEGHVELTPLEDAYYKLKELNADVNKWKSLEENRKIVQGWQKKIKDLPKDVILSAPGRMLMRDGKMKFADESLTKVTKGYCLLFNDMFIRLNKIDKDTFGFAGYARFDLESYTWNLEFYDNGTQGLQNVSDIFLQLKADKIGLKRPDAVSNAFIAGLKGLRKDEEKEKTKDKSKDKDKDKDKNVKIETFYFSCGDPKMVTEWAQDIDRSIKTTSLESAKKQNPEGQKRRRNRK